MNLLPWRQQQFESKSRVILIKTSIALCFIVCCGIGLFSFNQQLTQTLNEQKTQVQQQQGEMNQLTLEINKLRKEIPTQEKLHLMTNEQVFNAIIALNEFPPIQGEINQFTLTKQYTLLQGNTTNRHEFEPLQSYLTQYFPHIQITEFSPQQNGTLHFTFEQGEKP